MKRVLIIDDDQNIRDIFYRTLVQCGCEVRWASNAQMAISMLIRESADLVLLDINMPRINGCSVYDVLQYDYPGLKIIISSVYPIAKQQELIPKAAAYYDKSQGPIKLMEKITDVFSLAN